MTFALHGSLFIILEKKKQKQKVKSNWNRIKKEQKKIVSSTDWEVFYHWPCLWGESTD